MKKEYWLVVWTYTSYACDPHKGTVFISEHPGELYMRTWDKMDEHDTFNLLAFTPISKDSYERGRKINNPEGYVSFLPRDLVIAPEDTDSEDEDE